MKISKLINYSDCSDSRRESYSLSKSPESSISSSSFNLSVNSSYPCSPILQSSEYYLQMLAETASNLENLNYKDDQITTNEINGLNSVEIKNYFWFLVHRYIMMFHQNLTDQNQESLCT